jgi:hypothetical protein
VVSGADTAAACAAARRGPFGHKASKAGPIGRCTFKGARALASSRGETRDGGVAAVARFKPTARERAGIFSFVNVLLGFVRASPQRQLGRGLIFVFERRRCRRRTRDAWKFQRQFVGAFFGGRHRCRGGSSLCRTRAPHREWNSCRFVFRFHRAGCSRLRRRSSPDSTRHGWTRLERKLDALQHPQRKSKTNEQQSADNGDNARRHQAGVECVIVDRQAGGRQDHTGHAQQPAKNQQKQIHNRSPATIRHAVASPRINCGHASHSVQGLLSRFARQSA